jgi:hypothetical protein
MGFVRYIRAYVTSLWGVVLSFLYWGDDTHYGGDGFPYHRGQQQHPPGVLEASAGEGAAGSTVGEGFCGSQAPSCIASCSG